MPTNDPIQLAHMLIDRHGLRAGAVAQERATEARLGGQTEDLHRWRAVELAIVELRRTAHQPAATAAM